MDCKYHLDMAQPDSTPPASNGLDSRTKTLDMEVLDNLREQHTTLHHQLNPLSSSSSASPRAAVAAVSLTSVKLPPYWAADPVVWFAQVESLFATKNIVRQTTKFHHVIGTLAPEYAAEVRDMILAPPLLKPYDVLKEKLIERTQTSEHKRMGQLLNSEELGDRTPTQLLRKMQQLLGTNKMDDALFRQLFEQLLPSHVRMVLATSDKSMSIEEVARMADRVLDAATDNASIGAVSITRDDALQTLQEQVAKLTAAVQRLTDDQHVRFAGQGRPRRRSKSPVQTQGETSDGLCRLHRKFGKDAYHCVPPCTYVSENA